MAKQKKSDDLTTSIAQRILEKVRVIRESLPSMGRSTKKVATTKVVKKPAAKKSKHKKITKKAKKVVPKSKK